MAGKDFTGTVFGRLTVVGDDVQRSRPGKRYVLIRCVCGTEKSSDLWALTSGKTVSCGCKKSEHNLRHGHRRSSSVDPTYTSWDSMWQRCTNPKTPGFAHYGGRGIGVTERWRNFSSFLADMGARPSRDYEIERIDNDLGYAPENCRWATRSEQMRNTRNVIFVDWEGSRVSLISLSEKYGLPPGLVRQRVNNGWTPERALKTPYRKQ